MSRMIEIDWHPERRTLRQFGFIALLGFAALSAAAGTEVFLFSFGLGALRIPLAASFAAIGLLAAAFSLFAPAANRPLYLGLILLSFPIGWVVSQLVLTLLFFGLLVPIGAALRWTGHDALRRARDPSRSSYWSPARAQRPAESYFKQF